MNSAANNLEVGSLVTTLDGSRMGVVTKIHGNGMIDVTCQGMPIRNLPSRNVKPV